VTIVSHINTAQPGSAHASLRISAASAELGGCGVAAGCCAIASIAVVRRTERELGQLDLISARIAILREIPDPGERAHDYRVRNRD
jgi:hypothetical protein